ncbi:MAG: DHHW family protein [Oscillospiraceae bacterium]|nr:DHHW family protein [Oscillospiraceae bacterium]
MKRYFAIIAALALLAIPAFALGRGTAAMPLPARAVLEGGLPEVVESHIAQSFPGRDALTGWSLAIRVLGGQREYNQIFISGDELIPVLDPPLDYQVSENTGAILEFASQSRARVYTMIIPTVSAIRQQSLPSFFLGQSVFNQRQFIDQVYAEMLGGGVSTVDAYSALLEHREQYIFYRTENNLTSLGGFHLYHALGGHLDGMARPSLQRYDIEHVMYGFFGDLYLRSPFQNARGDILSIFRYRRTPPREYIVTIHRGGQTRTYHTLFPLHKLDLEGREMDIFMGGLGAKTVITASSLPFSSNLLVIGDHTALAFVPFLANHYRTVTLLDLSQVGEEEIYAVALDIGRDFYNQILIAYSIETYMHYPYPARILSLLPQPGEYWEY